MTEQTNNVRRNTELLIVDNVPTIRGEVDLLCVSELERWLEHFAGQAVAIDLSAVTFFDSSALRTFLAAQRRNHALRIARPSKPVQRVLEITATTDYLVQGRNAIW